MHENSDSEVPTVHVETRQVLERITDGFVAVDRAWLFTYINEAAERMIGRDRAELLGQNAWDSFPPAIDTPLYDACHNAMAERQSTNVEWYYPPFSSWYEARIYPSPEGISVFFQDITERKRLVEELSASEAKYRTLVEQMPAVVYILADDENETPVYFSPYIETLTGETTEEALAFKEHWFQLVHPEDLDRVAAEDRACDASGEPFRAEYRHVRKDGSYVWVRDECVPIKDEDGGIVGWQGVMLDISEHVRLEAVMAENRTKSQFLGMVSHELRTPMQSVLGYTALLLGGHRGPLTNEQREDLKYIHIGAKRVMTLIEQMLDLSHIDAGGLALNMQSVNLRDVMEQVHQEVVGQATMKGIAFHVDPSPSLPPVFGDPSRIMQILLILADNAVKFTDEGEVRISTAASPDVVEIAVHDTGIGIESEALPRIFDQFQQGDSSLTRRYSGAGLGLAVARELAELMGGRISVSSHPGQGSVFTLYLLKSDGTLSETQHVEREQ